jgi:hypothetical protein
MKEIFCIAAVTGKVLCLIVFVGALRPDVIRAVEASTEPAYCRIDRSRSQACGLNASAAASPANVGSCSAPPNVAHC